MALLARPIVGLERVVRRPVRAIAAVAPLRMGAQRRRGAVGIAVVVIGPIIIPVEPACEHGRRVPPAIVPAIAGPVVAIAPVAPVIAFADLTARRAYLSAGPYLVAATNDLIAATNAQRPTNLRSAHLPELAIDARPRRQSWSIKAAAPAYKRSRAAWRHRAKT